MLIHSFNTMSKADKVPATRELRGDETAQDFEEGLAAVTD